jgi:hypothetical protein
MRSRNFTATIDWGDGHTTRGTIKSLGSGRFAVIGTHRYAQATMFMDNLSIADNAGH